MSQGVQFKGHLTSIRTRSDGSLGISLESGEFTADEKLMIFNLQNIPCNIVLAPTDSELVPKEVKGEFQTKTPSQRLRNVLYIAWKQSGEFGQFETQYDAQMNKIIEEYKKKLKPV